jgi:hypothetical protein
MKLKLGVYAKLRYDARNALCCTACAHSNAYCPISYYYRAARSSASGLSSRQRGSVHLQSQRCFALAGQKPVDGVAAEWITYPNEREGADYW